MINLLKLLSNRLCFLFLIGLSLGSVSLTGQVRADECSFGVGGYCVNGLASETTQVIKDSEEKTTKEFKEKVEQIRSGASYYNYYETFWNEMVSAGLISEGDKVTAFDEAGKAGGTKIGGVNLVVLAARTLQELVDLELLTLNEAQEILNGAKINPVRD